MTKKTHHRPPKAVLIGIGAALLLALASPLLVNIPSWYHDRQMAAYEPVLYTAPPISEEISGEAREGCLLLGMELEEINSNPDGCLRLYWTPERLLRSERTWTDWYADQGEPLRCEDDGYVFPPSHDRLCDLDYIAYPALPSLDDPWWADEAVRDPGRVTDTGPVEHIDLEYLHRR